jgi:two-component system, chemotaxis family, protein-glutamate methylesterase/glutaminase
MRVVIIDDSALARQAVARTLSFDPELQIVGQAADAQEARQLVRELNPDVITLDLELPGMDGLGFLRNLMRLRPTPVIIISQHDQHHPQIQQALEIGAVGSFSKQGLLLNPDNAAGERLRNLVRHAKDAHQSPVMTQENSVTALTSLRMNSTVIGIGASTGGLTTLPELFFGLPDSTPPIVLVQHIAAPLSSGLVGRIQKSTKLEVSWATHGQQLSANTIYIAPAGRHLMVRLTSALASPDSKPNFSNNHWHFETRKPLPEDPHCPAVDPLFRSLAKSVGSGAIGVIMTGMGQDGAQGMLEIRLAGGATVAQDPESCVVKSMPSNAIKMGAVQHVLTPDQMGSCLEKLWNRLSIPRQRNAH